MYPTLTTQRSSRGFNLSFFQIQRRDAFRVMANNTENEKDAVLISNLRKRKNLAQDLSHRVNFLKRCAQRFRSVANLKDLNQCNHQEKSILGDLGSSLDNNNFLNQNGKYLHNTSHEYKQKSIFNLTLGLMKQLKMQKSQNLAIRLKRLLLTTIDPIHPFMYFWNLINILLIFYYTFAIFLEEAFPDEYLQFECSWKGFFVFSITILILDLMMGFNVKILVRGELLENKKEITIHYFQNGFLYDLLALITFTYLSFDKLDVNSQCQRDGQEKPKQILKYFFLLKFYRLSQLTKFFDYKFAFNQRMKRWMKLLKLFALMIMVAHLFACLWIIVGNYSYRFYNINWITKLNQSNLSDIEIYFKSLYFACMTMTTVGYGDILPTNIMEYILCIFLMIMSSAMFGYTLNTLTNIIQDFYKENEVYNNEVATLAKYMRKKNISLALQDRVLNYLQCMQAAGLNDDQQEEGRILAKLSQSLKEGLLMQEKGPMLQGSTAITEGFRDFFLNKILEQAQEVRFQPGEIVKPQINGYHQFNQSFIYVVRGQLDFFYENPLDKNEVKKMVKLFSLKSGERSGILNLFGQQLQNQYSIVSQDFTVLYIIKRQDLQNLVYSKQFINSEDRITYCLLQDKVRLYKDYKGFLLTCQICKGAGHEFQECKKFLYNPSLNIVVSKYTYSQKQHRKGFERKSRKFIQTSKKLQKRTDSRSISVQYQKHQCYDFIQENNNIAQIKLISDKKPQFFDSSDQESVESEHNTVKDCNKYYGNIKQLEQPQTDLVQSILNFRKQRLKIPNEHIQRVRQSNVIGKMRASIRQNENQLIINECLDKKISKIYLKDIQEKLDPEIDSFIQPVDQNRLHFEIFHNFSNYFCHNNLNVVIRKHNTMIQVKQQIKKINKSNILVSKLKRKIIPQKKKK